MFETKLLVYVWKSIFFIRLVYLKIHSCIFSEPTPSTADKKYAVNCIFIEAGCLMERKPTK